MKMFKKVLSAALSLAMVMGMSVSAFATETAAKVAKIGDIEYESIQAAINAEGTDATIVLLSDVTLSNVLTVNEKVTIDMAGFNIKYEGTEKQAISVTGANSGLTLTSASAAKIDAPNATNAIRVDDSATDAVLNIGKNVTVNNTVAVRGNDPDVDINGTVSVTGAKFAVCGSGGFTGGNFYFGPTANITSAHDVAVYLPNQDGVYTIDGSTITGSTAVEVRAGTLTVNGGTLKATGDYNATANGDGSTTTGVAIAVSQHTTGKKASVTVKDGTFTGAKALAEVSTLTTGYNPENTSLNVTGGDFNGGISSVKNEPFISGGDFDSDVTSMVKGDTTPIYIEDHEAIENGYIATQMSVGTTATNKVATNGATKITVDGRDQYYASSEVAQQSASALAAAGKTVSAPVYVAPVGYVAPTEPSWTWDDEEDEEEEIRYDVESGKNQKYTQNSEEGLTFKFDASFRKFKSIRVDGKKVASKYYTAEKGSTIITLSPEYLDTLDTGKHTLKVLFKDGYAQVKFTVLEGAKVVAPSAPAEVDKTNPSTGSNDFVGAAAALAVVSVAAGAVLVKKH